METNKPYFHSTLCVENEHGETWKLTAPLLFASWHGDILAPDGFVTDFASIPPLSTIAGAVLALAMALAKLWQPAWVIVAFAWLVVMLSYALSCDNLLDAPATVHDYLYSVQDRPRAECDHILLLACLANGVAKWKVIMVYANVRLFGWAAWRSDQKKYGLNH